MTTEISSDILSTISDTAGITKPALKLLLTVLAGYPLGLLHRKYLYGKDEILQHLFFTFTGFILGYWNYGVDIFHCVFTICFTYCTLWVLKGSAQSVAVTFIFNLGYLLIGYYYCSTNNYDINWTMPYCILVLRLIGIAYDHYDGKQPCEKLSKDSQKVALNERPSILQMFGHCFFPAAFLVGPQFSMKRYQDFVSGKFSKKGCTNLPPDCVEPAMRRFALGVLYVLIFQVLKLFVTDEYLLTDEFANSNFFRRMLLLGMWGRGTLYKYISCWLLSEGACILFGLAHNGEDENGDVKWDGVENIKLSVFENTTEFSHYIQSFNVNTNHWVGQYVYKRLKFLGNRYISQLTALLFLAVWHGFHSGYYICFLFEFLVIYMERDIKSIIKSNETLSNIFYAPQLQRLLQILLRVYTFVFMGWCLIPFALLNFERYWKGYGNVSYVGILLFGMWPFVYSPILRFFLTKKIRKIE